MTVNPSSVRPLPREPRELFVYGSLTVSEVLRALLGRDPEVQPVTVRGWRVAGVRDRAYPALVPAEGAVSGLLLSDLDEGEWCLVDRFEAVTYSLRQVHLEDGRAAWTYVWSGPAASILPEDWDRDRFRAEHLREYVELTAAWVGR